MQVGNKIECLDHGLQRFDLILVAREVSQMYRSHRRQPSWGQMARLAIAFLGLVPASLWAQHSAAADFDGNGRVDLDDLLLLQQAVGGTEVRFDLDGSGRVDAGDLFGFADAIGSIGQPLWPEQATPYTARTGRQELILSMPQYSVRVRHGMPFGISSLKHRGQLTDFAHPDLPLADWEWLWYGTTGIGQRRHKLLEQDWGLPVIRKLPDRLEALYTLPVSRNGVVAKVRYVFAVASPSFHVTYSVFNGSPRKLTGVYLMLGLPGFSNHGHITGVASAQAQRAPVFPADEFLSEAALRNQPEYLLLRHDARRDAAEGLKGSLQLRDNDKTFQLSSYYLSSPADVSVYSAHTNKPRYLTSHLYARTGNLEPRQRRSLTIHHVLSDHQAPSGQTSEASP